MLSFADSLSNLAKEEQKVSEKKKKKKKKNARRYLCPGCPSEKEISLDQDV